jgi:hypothetical protein
MNWAGISVFAGLVLIASAMGPAGAVLLAIGVAWLWRKG